MLNVGGGELLVILLVALIVLGPDKLPEAARQIGAVTKQLRRISDGFQSELKAALEDPIETEARSKGEAAVAAERAAADSRRVVPAPRPHETELDSPAAAAGMYDVHDDGSADNEPAGDAPEAEAEAIDSPASNDGGAETTRTSVEGTDA